MNGLVITETLSGFVVQFGCNGYVSAPMSLSRALADAQAHVPLLSHKRLELDRAGASPSADDAGPVGRFGRAVSTEEAGMAHASIADAIGEVATRPFLDELSRRLGYLPAAVLDAVVPALTLSREVALTHRRIAERAGR